MSRTISGTLFPFLVAISWLGSQTALTGEELKAALTSPAPGSTLAGPEATFSWDAGMEATAYWLYAGSSVGATDYFDSGSTATQSLAVPGLPTDGSTVHVRLFTQLPVAGWVSEDYEFSAVAHAQIIDPVPGSSLPGSRVTFSWTSVAAADAYRIEIGNAEGGNELFDSGSITTTSQAVSGLPLNGTSVYVRLSTSIPGSAWTFNNYTFTTYSILPGRPEDFHVEHIWSAELLKIPGHLGGLMFTRDGNTLYVVGASETVDSALYSVPVTRDPVTKRVTGLGPAASVVFSGAENLPGLDAGWEFGPDDTLFYTYWSANQLGQRPGGVSGSETLFDMSLVNLPVSVAGLTFSPHLDDTQSGFGMMQVSVWQGDDVINVPLRPMGSGLYEPKATQLFVSLPRQGTGAIQYIPSGLYEGNLMYVNWDFGEIRMVVIDPITGYPIDDATGRPTLGTANPRTVLFASGLGVGPWGLEFDPFTYDFFVSTWSGDPFDSILHFSGSGLPAPTGELRILGLTVTGGNLSIEWEGPVGWDHTLEFSENLEDWTGHLTVPEAPAFNRRNFPLPAASPGFFRISAAP